ncbi:TetR/AcrR family transcriptional regulator [Streptomyces sp. NPDC052496]|uniref:TetR/AcrR family transcriptional regulator n=1 Tax=Streptomyces sp. NPDC052496 TaxID=3154951 RepID=UPI00341479A9
MDPEALWTPAERPRRGRPPAHTRAEITAAAVALADTEGLGAVTMRAVAARIGAGTMSLYSYVPDKETLLELMIDEVSGGHRLPSAPSGDWRADLRHLFREQRALMRRHPWLPAALPARQTFGPHTLAALEYALTVLEHAGLDGQAGLEVFSLLSGFVASHVTHELAQEGAPGSDSRAVHQAQARHLRSPAVTGAYPKAAEALTAPGGTPSPDATFDRLLTRMIDGLTAGG